MSLKINKRQFKKWIAALDSGEYKQGAGQLNYNDRYCCLGVGCKVLIPNKVLYIDHGQIAGGWPGSQPAAPIWLKGINIDFDNKTGMSLSYLNDEKGYTFPEIATLLELVYIHKILD